MDRPHLFNAGLFTLHSGGRSKYIIDCNALVPDDWDALALMASERMPVWGAVEGVPQGGLAFAAALRQFSRPEGKLLVVDDVLSTGNSMESQRAGRTALGLVLFARDQCPDWVRPMFPFFGER